MRVTEVSTYGGPGVLRLAEWPDPAQVANKVRVRVRAATVNPTDLVTRQGLLAARTPNATPPIVVGWEFAGELIDPAPDLAAGRRVAGMFPWFTVGDGTGTYAEMVLAEPGWLAPLPQGADLIEASTVAMNGQTAQQILPIAAPQPGQTLLVTGASGAVGGFVVQLAAANGVQVIAVASRGDEDYVRSLGASEVLGRLSGDDLVSAVRERYADGVDAVIDAAASGPEQIGAVRDGGRYATVLDPVIPLAERGIHVGKVDVVPESQGLADLIDQWASGRLRTRIAGTVPLAEAAEAHRRLESGGVRGKLVLTM